jgi:DNA mismatch repair protein MutS
MATPVRTQYLEMKARHPDALLLFRMGDFYETFDEDARIVARDMEIVLTQRDMGQGEVVPLAGIPYHALDRYLARLIRKGHRVAICEQISVPDGKRLVDRDVVRVVTPGTIIEPDLLKQGANNYLAAVATNEVEAGIAYVDVTTGEFGVTQVDLATLPQEIARLDPSEVLVPLSGATIEHVRDDRGEFIVTPVPDAWYAPSLARRRLLEHFEVTSLEAFGCDNLPLAISAAAAILDYLADTYKSALPLLTGLRTYAADAFMALDPQTRRNLELFEGGRQGTLDNSLLRVLDQTETPMGARLLRRWIGQPLLDLDELVLRQDAVSWMKDSGVRRQQVRDSLKKISDIERALHRIAAGAAIPREIVGLRHSLEQVPTVEGLLADGVEGSPLGWLSAGLDPCEAIVVLVADAIADDPQGDVGGGKVVREGFSKELDELRSASLDARSYIAGLERRERERSGIANLKVGYNRVFGYYLEVTKSSLDNVPEDYIRRQTLVNAERFFTPELKEYESLVLNASERMEELETALWHQVCRQISDAAGRIAQTASAIAAVDAFASLGQIAALNGYVRPTLDDGRALHIKNGRHPVVERLLPTGAFIANDSEMATDANQLIMLTGPNMAGKSTYLRQVALIVLMAQIGSFVPADECHVGLVDRIFTRVGLQDDLAAGQSTFMVEMVETAAILHHATPRSLVVLDEIGRGTSTYDGLSIAQAVAEHIHDDPRLGCRTLFATHYHELIELADRLPRVANYSVAVSEDDGDVVFLHRIVAGGADRSYGVHVAQLAGLPRPVVSRAWELLAILEADDSSNGMRSVKGKGKPAIEQAEQQLDFFGTAPPEESLVLDALRVLELNGMTPLEALNKLYELQQQAGE